jgi:hypothetical protein
MNVNDRDRRLRLMTFAARKTRLLGDLSRYWFRFTGLPIDAEIVNVAYELMKDEWCILLCSDEFEIVPSGTLIPFIDLTIESKESLPA